MNNLIICDLDNTLLDTSHIKALRKTKDGVESYITVKDFDTDPDKNDPNVIFDYSYFDRYETNFDSIVNASPIIKNIELVGRYLDEGYEFVFLTARSNERAVKAGIKVFCNNLQRRGLLKHLTPNKLRLDLSKAIWDEKYSMVYDKMGDEKRKGEVLTEYCRLYRQIIFLEDDDKILKYVKSLRLNNLKIIDAK